MNNIEIIKYSEKAIVVAGDGTKAIKSILKGAGGKWNSRLVNPITHKPLMGWIFSRSRETALLGLLSGNGIKYDRVTPANFNDATASYYITDPAEIDADNFCQRNNI